MSYMVISSVGEIQLHALTLMGATTKRDDDSKIGYFGTGNKYAIACLLRNDIGLRIFSGEEELVISTDEITLGDTKHDVVSINGHGTSITTSMGPSWDVWQAVREIHSNALDCGEYERAELPDAVGVAGRTCFCIELTDAVRSIKKSWDKYFSDGRESVFSVGGDSILSGSGSGVVYRNGIRCNPIGDTGSAYDYDLNGLDIGEDRLASYSWHVARHIWNMIFLCEDQGIHRKALDASIMSKHVESDALSHFCFTCPTLYSPTFLDFVSNTMLAKPDWSGDMSKAEIEKSVFIHPVLMDSFLENIGTSEMILPSVFASGEKPRYQIIEAGPGMEAVTEQCLSILGSFMDMPYPIKYARFDKPTTLARALTDEKVILLSAKLFHQGATVVLAAILEEYIHIEYCVADNTRAMQDATFNLMATALMQLADKQLEAA